MNRRQLHQANHQTHLLLKKAAKEAKRDAYLIKLFEPAANEIAKAMVQAFIKAATKVTEYFKIHNQKV